jgi:uncharacterized protein
MMTARFEWDEDKARANWTKHNVSFDEAKGVFEDPLYVDFYDPDHSENEERFIIIGRSCQQRLLVVSDTERGERTRLISAREATRQEKTAYEEG